MANKDAYNDYTHAQVGIPREVPFEEFITLTLVNANNFEISDITSNFTLENPLKINKGQTGYIALRQSGSTTGDITLGSVWKTSGGNALSLTQTPNAVDTLEYRVLSETEIHVGLVPDWK